MSTRGRQRDLTMLDLPKGGADDGQAAFDPARIATRDAGEAPADLRRNGGHPGRLRGWEWGAPDEGGAGPLRSGDPPGVRDPFPRAAGPGEGVTAVERRVGQGEPRARAG